jgi:predicted restriction endonuclease
MNRPANILDPDYSWNALLMEAQRWVREDIGCRSNGRGRRYTITQVRGEGTTAIIHIEREVGHEPSDLGYRRFRNFLARFTGRNRMKDDRDEHRVDVAIVTTIVHLHPYLSFSDDKEYIEVLLHAKEAAPGARYVNQSSAADRQLIAREIRQGQGRFRQELLTAYRSTCCITGTNIEEVLDAAHIIPYAVNRNSHSTNGLLLRSDIHNLFDDGLLKVDPVTFEVRLHADLRGSHYSQYANLKIAVRQDALKPDFNALTWHSNNTHW